MFATEDLATLDAVLAEGSFEAAARRLHLTPSAVSQRIRSLESRAGQVLVQRIQPTAPTDAGRVVWRLAQQMAALQAETRAGLQGTSPAASESSQASNDLGAVRVAVAVNSDSLATWWIETMATFCALPGHGGVCFDLRVDDQDHTADLLKSGEVHAAVTSEPKPLQGCRVEPLGAMRYRAVCSPEFLQQHALKRASAPAAKRSARPSAAGPSAALSLAPCLVFNRKDSLQHRFMGAAVEPQHVHYLPSASGFVLATCAGIGWGMCPEIMCENELQSGALVALAGDPGAYLDVPLYWQHINWDTRLMKRLSAHVQRSAASWLASVHDTN
jgi:LysR family transcriptional regulator, chromosome initiation inhibitor